MFADCFKPLDNLIARADNNTIVLCDNKIDKQSYFTIHVHLYHFLDKDFFFFSDNIL